jgi:hypothetical protein
MSEHRGHLLPGPEDISSPRGPATVGLHADWRNAFTGGQDRHVLRGSRQVADRRTRGDARSLSPCRLTGVAALAGLAPLPSPACRSLQGQPKMPVLLI